MTTGAHLHLLLVPNMVRKGLLDLGHHPDDHPRPLLVHQGLPGLARQAGFDDCDDDSLSSQNGQLMKNPRFSLLN